MITAKTASADLTTIRAQIPLVHNITNYVVMQQTANALLALGASPVMAHAEEEMEDMARWAGAIVINMGTLDEAWVRRMALAVTTADKLKKPCVFDPVGAGATPYRTEVAQRLMTMGKSLIIRGNASEIMALANKGEGTKGVDSLLNTDRALDVGMHLAEEYGHTIVISGAKDLIITQGQCVGVSNGVPMMTKVTGMGCTATAIIGAFAAVNANALQAGAHAMMVLGIAGEIAMKQAQGPGSFQYHILDALYHLTAEQIGEYAKIAIE